jgi:hypothetical protein
MCGWVTPSGLAASELLLIYILSRRLSRPIESTSRDLKSVETLSFDQPISRPSNMREIAQFQSAAALLRNSLRSFCSFAPAACSQSNMPPAVANTITAPASKP